MKPQTTIEQDAAARHEIMHRRDAWQAIYDECASGNGETGYRLFEAELLRAFTQGAMPGRQQ